MHILDIINLLLIQQSVCVRVLIEIGSLLVTASIAGLQSFFGLHLIQVGITLQYSFLVLLL